MKIVGHHKFHMIAYSICTVSELIQVTGCYKVLIGLCFHLEVIVIMLLCYVTTH